jgi:hypothetical protein
VLDPLSRTRLSQSQYEEIALHVNYAPKNGCCEYCCTIVSWHWVYRNVLIFMEICYWELHTTGKFIALEPTACSKKNTGTAVTRRTCFKKGGKIWAKTRPFLRPDLRPAFGSFVLPLRRLSTLLLLMVSEA